MLLLDIPQMKPDLWQMKPDIRQMKPDIRPETGFEKGRISGQISGATLICKNSHRMLGVNKVGKLSPCSDGGNI